MNTGEQQEDDNIVTSDGVVLRDLNKTSLYGIWQATRIVSATFRVPLNSTEIARDIGAQHILVFRLSNSFNGVRDLTGLNLLFRGKSGMESNYFYNLVFNFYFHKKYIFFFWLRACT